MTGPKHTEKQSAEKKPKPAANPTVNLQSNAPNAVAETPSLGNQEPGSQSAMLQRMPTAQQHSLMRQMGQIQGNRYAQQIAAQMRPATSVQRTPDTTAQTFGASDPKGCLSQLHPDMRSKVEALIENAHKKGLNIQVFQGMRTIAEQDALYAKGRTAPGSVVTNAKGGESYHNYGVAVDVVFHGAAPWGEEHDWSALGAAGKEAGLVWGGDWTSFVDRPHFQYPGVKLSQLQAWYAAGGMENVWKNIGGGKEEAALDEAKNEKEPAQESKSLWGRITSWWQGLWNKDKNEKDEEGPAAPAVIGTATVLANALNVRSSPQFSGSENILGTLKKGDQAEVLEKSNCLKISYNGGVAYISASPQYVTFTEKPAEETAPEEKNKDSKSLWDRIASWWHGLWNNKETGGTSDVKEGGLTGLEKTLQSLETLQATDTAVTGERNTALWVKAKNDKKAEIEDQGILNDYKFQTEGDQSQKITELIKQARTMVDALTLKDVQGDASNLAAIKADYYRRLAKVTPYYTQIANKAILSETSGVYKGAWWRTCNVTSLSMALSGLGISPADFQGDKELLKKIAQQLGVPQNQLNRLSTWRLPDFLQLVAVYRAYVEKNGTQFDATKVEAARASATGQVLAVATLGKIGQLFGAATTNGYYNKTYGTQNNDLTKEIDRHKERKNSLNAEITAVQGEIGQLAQQGPASLVKLDTKTNYEIWKKPQNEAAHRAEYEKQRAKRSEMVTAHQALEGQYNDASGGEKPALATIKEADDKIVTADGVMVSKLQTEIDTLTGTIQSYKDNDAKLQAFRQYVIENVGAKINTGSQVFVNVPGHYVRLENVNEEGIVIDDPAWGKNMPLTWKQSYDAGYFRAYQILSK